MQHIALPASGPLRVLFGLNALHLVGLPRCSRAFGVGFPPSLLASTRSTGPTVCFEHHSACSCCLLRLWWCGTYVQLPALEAFPPAPLRVTPTTIVCLMSPASLAAPLSSSPSWCRLHCLIRCAPYDTHVPFPCTAVVPGHRGHGFSGCFEVS